MNENCANCRYGKSFKEEVVVKTIPRVFTYDDEITEERTLIKCRRYPPYDLNNGIGGGIGYPEMSQDEWCGEWAVKDE